jgi:hypothetical protein
MAGSLSCLVVLANCSEAFSVPFYLNFRSKIFRIHLYEYTVHEQTCHLLQRYVNSYYN